MASNLQVKGYLPVEEIKKRDVTFFIISFISAMSCCGMLPDTSIIKAISITTGHSKRWIFTRSDLNRICASATIMDKSPWENNAISIFFCHSGFLHKTVHLFRNFLAVLPPPTLYGYNAETRKTFWGKGLGLCELENAQKCKSVPAFVHDCSLIYYTPKFCHITLVASVCAH